MTMQPLEADDPRAAGEFRLRARLGAGGMGQVYLGYSPAGRAVAVKICHPEFAADPAFVTRFAREVAAARAVNGLYTAQVVGAGPDDSPPWLATSYVPGPSLQHAVAGHGPLPGPAVWRLAAGLAEALQAVHARGLVHRDLKPTNVLLAADGPRLIDFGIARAVDGIALTTVGYVLGTPAYMSPEQADGQSASPASDVFALGSVLCFAATGEPPFGDGEPAAVLYRIVHAEPALDSVPGALRDLVAGCLAKDQADRLPLAQVLRTCQAQTPELSGPSASYWPGQVAALIARYQVGFDETARRLDLAGPVSEPTQTTYPAAPDGAVTPGPGGAPQPARRARLVSRRWVLAAAGLTAAGLTAGGWALASSGSGGPPATQPLWARKTGGPVSSGAALDNGILYIGSGDGHVYAFEAASGRPVRTFRTSGAVTGGVTVTGGMLFAGSADHHVYAFRADTGEQAWAYPTDGPVNGTPTMAGGTVYIGSDDGYLYAIDAGTGHLAWRYPTGGPVRSAPQLGSEVYAGSLYVASESSHLYGLGTGTSGTTAGKLQWRFTTSGPVIAGLVYDQGEICVGDTSGHLTVMDGSGPLQGVGTYKQSVGGAVRGKPAAAGTTIFFGTAASTVRAANIYGGRSYWSYPTSGPVSSGPAVNFDGTTVYAGDDHGYVYAIDATTITSLWSYQAGAAVQSQILLANSVVYFGSLDHHVYALPALDGASLRRGQPKTGPA
jgi:outer membrane protein assembly factor BamB